MRQSIYCVELWNVGPSYDLTFQLADVRVTTTVGEHNAKTHANRVLLGRLYFVNCSADVRTDRKSNSQSEVLTAQQ
jgi:hypothetical protein